MRSSALNGATIPRVRTPHSSPELPMRTIQLHPLSVLVGLGIATLAFVAME
jgi:hypothetical protein